MTTARKYHVIEAQTLEARTRHRILIEKALQKIDLTPEMRNQLMWELKKAVIKEVAAQKAVDEEEDEDKKGKQGDGGSDGSEGGNAGGSSSGEGGGGMGRSEEQTDIENEDGALSDLEVFELLLFLAEHDTTQSPPADTSFDIASDQALGAATLLYDREEKIALIGEVYSLEHGNDMHGPAAFLPSLEHHAARLGAQSLHVNVHHNAVELFKKFGYEIHRQAPGRTGTPLQTMRKTLALHARPIGTDCV